MKPIHNSRYFSKRIRSFFCVVFFNLFLWFRGTKQPEFFDEIYQLELMRRLNFEIANRVKNVMNYSQFSSENLKEYERKIKSNPDLIN